MNVEDKLVADLIAAVREELAAEENYNVTYALEDDRPGEWGRLMSAAHSRCIAANARKREALAALDEHSESRARGETDAHAKEKP